MHMVLKPLHRIYMVLKSICWEVSSLIHRICYMIQK